VTKERRLTVKDGYLKINYPNPRHPDDYEYEIWAVPHGNGDLVIHRNVIDKKTGKYHFPKGLGIMKECALTKGYFISMGIEEWEEIIELMKTKRVKISIWMRRRL
jgi:hypothetical protein